MSTAIVPTTATETARIEKLIPGTALNFGDTARLAKTLFDSQLLGSKIKSPQQAFAIIVAGAEMGLPPMLSLRSIALVEGKPVVAADAQLGAFKRAGGRAAWRELSEKRTALWLRHPNGDEHVEVWTEAMASAAGLLMKDNWKKHRLAMMRSRTITAGLKSVGFEAAAGAYDPDEAQHFATGDTAVEVEQMARESVTALDQITDPDDPRYPDPDEGEAVLPLEDARKTNRQDALQEG